MSLNNEVSEIWHEILELQTAIECLGLEIFRISKQLREHLDSSKEFREELIKLSNRDNN